MEKNDLASSYFNKSFLFYQKLPISRELANYYDGLAQIAYTQNLFQVQRDLYDKSLEIRKNLHIDYDTDYAQVLTNKAMAYQKQGDYQQADSLYQQSFTLLI